MQQLNRVPDDSYALALHRKKKKEVGVGGWGAHDPYDTKADISSLIRLRNDCNESE